MLKDNNKNCIVCKQSCVSENEAEKVSRGSSPSMCRIVKAPRQGPRRASALMLLMLLTIAADAVRGADLVIEVPGAGAGGDGHYRLDYRPPYGEPRPNYTVPARASTINFQGQPGTQYHFMLYYSNASLADLLTWNQTIVTAPEPPARLHVLAGKNKQALVTWQPPARGAHSGFRFRVLALTPGAGGAADFVAGADERTHTLRDLHPGATYQLHAFTTLSDKESAAYASTNFTTKPNTPGKFIVWFRNETTLLVLWQPPYPPGAYTHYKVSILPADARDAELYVEKEGEPPGPAQAAFKGLVPGRAYNISVQTVSEPEISAPTTAQYRTVPLRPRDVTAAAGAGWLEVAWRAPLERCEFDRYQVALTGARRVLPAPVPRDAAPRYRFEGLTPGAQYAVSVKTMSGKVTSWPAQLDVTLKPLPVTALVVTGGDEKAPLALSWAPAAGSLQDSFRITYRELDAADPHRGELTVPRAPAELAALLPGRNYSLEVRALSRDAAADPTATTARTRPRPPRGLRALPLPPGDHALRLEWEPDPASRQDAWRVRWRRAGAGAAGGDTGTARVTEAAARAEALFPGAAYEVFVRAEAGGVMGPEQALVAAVPPLPPESVSVSRASSDAALVRWAGPDRALSAVGGFVLRYRTRSDAAWTLLPPIAADQTEAEVVDMTRGERYTIQLDAASEPAAAGAVESGRPLRAEHAVEPPPVTDVAALLDANNLTLEWPRPEGRVERYEIRWWPQEEDGPPGAARTQDLPAGDRRTLRARLDRLDPGARYVLAVAAHSAGLVSPELRLVARTRPVCQSELTVVAEDDGPELRAFRALYTATPPAAARFDRYRVTLQPADGSVPARVEERAADAERRVRFDGLEPGRLYNVSLATLSRNVSSQPVTRQQRPAPGPARGLRVELADATRVLLAWEPPAGLHSDFEVQYAEAPDRLRTVHTASPRLEVAGLRPHTEYTFSVEARAGPEDPRRSAPASVRARTREAAPGALELAVSSRAPGAAELTWSLAEPGGEVRRVVVRYWPTGREAEALEREFPGLGAGGALAGLAAGRRYEVSAWAETGAGRGPAAHAAVWVPVGPPVARAVPAEGARTASTLSLRFSSSLFGSEHGEVTAYTAVVWQAGAAPPSAWPLPSWQDVQRFSVWPPYQATEPYFPFGSRDDAEITLGTERCERARRLYCNGPLKPATTYHVALRAFTAPDQFADTARLTLTTDADATGWAWAGGALGVVALLAAGGAAVWRLRARAPPPPARPSRPVPLDRFAEHCRLMAADSDFRFSEEFEELKRVGRDQPCTAADLPCNRPKNRFTNVLPYEHSRYKLQPVDDEEGSDYINANYVPGHASPREFIVTQGPLHSTRDDFWRMVWESGARAIVMLTRLVEKGRDKCERYWPADGRPARFGDVSVSVLAESRFPDWVVSELAVSRGPESRRLPHLHFTTWPDFGVPAPPHTLARFVRAFRDRVEGARPVVVHCSAGVGRSGTFVALDRALQQLAAGAGSLDVFGLVAALRSERPHMVQTEQQYIAIHQCVLAALDGQDLRPPPPLSNDNAAYDDDEGIAESGM